MDKKSKIEEGGGDYFVFYVYMWNFCQNQVKETISIESALLCGIDLIFYSRQRKTITWNRAQLSRISDLKIEV